MNSKNQLTTAYTDTVSNTMLKSYYELQSYNCYNVKMVKLCTSNIFCILVYGGYNNYMT